MFIASQTRMLHTCFRCEVVSIQFLSVHLGHKIWPKIFHLQPHATHGQLSINSGQLSWPLFAATRLGPEVDDLSQWWPQILWLDFEEVCHYRFLYVKELSYTSKYIMLVERFGISERTIGLRNLRNLAICFLTRDLRILPCKAICSAKNDWMSRNLWCHHSLQRSNRRSS